MSYLEPGEEGEPRTRQLALKIAALAIIAVVAILTLPIGSIFDGGDDTAGGADTASAANTPERIGAELLSDPASRDLFTLIRAAYPREYRQLLERLSEIRPVGDKAEEARQIAAFANRLMIDHFDGLARAPDDQLHALARDNAILARALRATDVELCARWFSEGFLPDDRVAPEVSRIRTGITMKTIEAMRVGETQPREARRGPRESDSKQFQNGLRARSPEVLALFSEDRIDQAPPDRRCEAAVITYETIASLPPDAAAYIIVQFLRTGREPAPPG
jgi:hypothetical protein